jgi:tryptophan halogenase
MLNLRTATHVVVLGGGTAGWFAALTLRKMFNPAVEVRVVESRRVPVAGVGVGAGGLVNLVHTLNRLDIPTSEFMRETGGTFKLGFAYDGWRTGADDDRYYHLFAAPNADETRWNQAGFFPLISALLANRTELHRYIAGVDAIEHGASQGEVGAMLVEGKSGLATSFHFDGGRVATFLKHKALSRGVAHTEAQVEDIELNDMGDVTGVLIDGQRLPADLLVDASGLARAGIGKRFAKQFGIRWRSFSDCLLPDRAIAFDVGHSGAHPALVTRATAMSAGWMWQVPLVERVGAGYVFSRAHLDADAAVAEAQAKLGTKVGTKLEPHRVLDFDSGYFERVWVRNLMALGLASGCVEPLAAASIGQMLEQLRSFERVVVDCDGVVPDSTIDEFNRANGLHWEGIRDFVRMHYDGGRDDLPFWRDAARAQASNGYAELKRCFALRTPRVADLGRYTAPGWQALFHTLDWMFVGAPLGVIQPEAAQAELMSMPPALRNKVAEYLARMQAPRAGGAVPNG